jgi:CO/xanthine dehydrogenase Mo-binding subunit
MIDWQKVADDNGLSVEEFKKEVYTIAACIGIMDVDNKNGEAVAMRFTCFDDVGKIEMMIKRIED